jgi:hypothetical protein
MPSLSPAGILGALFATKSRYAAMVAGRVSGSAIVFTPSASPWLAGSDV